MTPFIPDQWQVVSFTAEMDLMLMFKPCRLQEKEVGRRAVESWPFMYLNLLEISFPRKDVMGKGWMHGWMGKVFLIALLKTRVCYLCVPEKPWHIRSLWSCRFREQSVREMGLDGTVTLSLQQWAMSMGTHSGFGVLPHSWRMDLILMFLVPFLSTLITPVSLPDFYFERDNSHLLCCSSGKRCGSA